MNFLIVDDDVNKAQRAIEFLNSDQYEIAGSYVEAMRKLLQNKYDAIILDMGLPRDSEASKIQPDYGLDILYEMRRKKIKTPVCVFSSSEYDVSEYENVFGYILFNAQVSIEKRFREFYNKLIV